MRPNFRNDPTEKGSVRELLRRLSTYSDKLRAPTIAALILAACGAVLTIIGPNQLSRITDLISDGLFTGIDLAAVGRTGIVRRLSGSLRRTRRR